jgi:hypothetical protein
LLAAIGASFVGIYPVSLRLMLFAGPLVLLLLASGLQAVTEGLREPRARRAWVLIGATLAVPLSAISLLQLTRYPPEDVRALTHQLQQRRGGEPAYIFAGSIPPWLFYSTEWAAPDCGRLRFGARLAAAGGPAFENAPSRGEVRAGEGTGLEYASAGGPELYGLPTGIEWTPSLGPLKREPDAGWADTEATRIVAAGTRAMWVLMSHLVGGETALLRALERRGACATYVQALDNAVLLRYVPKSEASAGQCHAVP